MNKLLKFIVVAASENPVEITVNPTYIETVVDGTPFGHQGLTQVTMNSGSKFFVKQSYAEVCQQLVKE